MAPKKNQPSTITVKVTENNQTQEDLAFIKTHSVGGAAGAAGGTVAANLNLADATFSACNDNDTSHKKEMATTLATMNTVSSLHSESA